MGGVISLAVWCSGFMLGVAIGVVLTLLTLISAAGFYAVRFGTAPIDVSAYLRRKSATDAEGVEAFMPPHAGFRNGWEGPLIARRSFKPSTSNTLFMFGNSSTTEVRASELTSHNNASSSSNTATPADSEDESNTDSQSNTNATTGGNLTRTSTTSTINSTHDTTSAVPHKPQAGIFGGLSNAYKSAKTGLNYRRQQKDTITIKENVWGKVQGSILFLYEDNTKANCLMSLNVEDYEVFMEKPEMIDGKYTNKSIKFAGKDSEMFNKKNACVLRLKEDKRISVAMAELEAKRGTGGGGSSGGAGGVGGTNQRGSMPVVTRGMGDIDPYAPIRDKIKAEELENAPWFLFTKRPTDMENLYTALVQVSSQKADWNDVFDYQTMALLLFNIDETPGEPSLRAFNAAFGRIWLGIEASLWLQSMIVLKIEKKLTKVSFPSYIQGIKIHSLHVGSTPPSIHNLMLKSHTKEGETSGRFGVTYKPDITNPDSFMRAHASATVVVPRMKSTKFVVEVIAEVRSLEGHIEYMIKPPPSNRIWWAFTEKPAMDLKIRPVIYDKEFTTRTVLELIEKYIKDAMKDAVVLPNMDDIAFFDTSDLPVRGGIYSQAGRSYESRLLKQQETQLSSGTGSTIQTQTTPAAIAASGLTSSSTPAVNQVVPDEIISSNEDPNSASLNNGSSTALRNRRQPRSNTTHISGNLHDNGTESDPENNIIKPIQRTETAPVAGIIAPASGPANKRNTWLSQIALPGLKKEESPLSSSTSSPADIPSNNQKPGFLSKIRSNSNERKKKGSRSRDQSPDKMADDSILRGTIGAANSTAIHDSVHPTTSATAGGTESVISHDSSDRELGRTATNSTTSSIPTVPTTSSTTTSDTLGTKSTTSISSSRGTLPSGSESARSIGGAGPASNPGTSPQPKLTVASGLNAIRSMRAGDSAPLAEIRGEATKNFKNTWASWTQKSKGVLNNAGPDHASGGSGGSGVGNVPDWVSSFKDELVDKNSIRRPSAGGLPLSTSPTQQKPSIHGAVTAPKPSTSSSMLPPSSTTTKTNGSVGTANQPSLVTGVSGHEAKKSTGSLQDRLNAASQASAATLPVNIPKTQAGNGRNRSGTGSSMGSVQSSASPNLNPSNVLHNIPSSGNDKDMSASENGGSKVSNGSNGFDIGSPSNGLISSIKPTTEVSKDEVIAPLSSSASVTALESTSKSSSSSGSASPSKIQESSNHSGNGSISIQPTMGKGMVVPRVPKRPGEVTGIGSTPESGMTRRVSASEGDKETEEKRANGSFGSDTAAGQVPPPLPVRKPEEAKTPMEEVRTSEEGRTKGEEKEEKKGTSNQLPTLPARSAFMPTAITMSNKPELPPRSKSPEKRNQHASQSPIAGFAIETDLITPPSLLNSEDKKDVKSGAELALKKVAEIDQTTRSTE